MTKLRAGIVGLGVMGRHHLRILSQLDGVDLVGVFDPALAAADAPLGKTVFPTLDALLDSHLDYCVLSAPTAFHLDLGLQLAERGIHTMIEKPVAADSKQAEQLVHAFATRNLVGGVGHVERFNPAIQAMRQKIEAGLLGDVYQVTTHRQGPFPARVSDVGVIKDLATHDIDLTMWIMQRGYQSVAAQTAHRSGRQHEDMLGAIGKLEGGINVNHIVNWLTPFKERRTTVIGENGALVADTLTADLTFYENGTQSASWDGISSFRGVSEGNILRFALAKTEPLLAEHQAFRNAVLSRDTTNIVTLVQGLATVQVADLLIAS
jgi:predicted dehydrogenase